MKKKKYKLILNDDFDFVLAGIVCFDKIYKLSWQLNNILKTDFVKSDNLDIHLKKQDITKSFEVFSSATDNSNIIFSLIANKCDKGFLIKQFKNIDYFLRLSIEPGYDYGKIIEQIRLIPSVTSSFHIDTGLLSNTEKEYFIF